MLNNFTKSKYYSFALLWLVVFIWGVSPVVVVYLSKYMSTTVLQFIMFFVAVIALTIINFKHLKEIDKNYLKCAVPTGAFIVIASLLQKIGILYTTPANYAFLENLSIIIVPFLVWILAKKKPNKLNAISIILCLAGAFILSKVSFTSFNLSIGDALCAIAGLLYGVNIAVTGVYAKKFKPQLYVYVQMVTVVANVTVQHINQIIYSIRHNKLSPF